MPDDHVSAARAVYDASADRYLEFVSADVSEATEAPVDRSLLTAFIEMLAERRSGRTADVGCGPGRVAAYLAARGVSVIGFDVSSAMLASARRAHPGIEFEEGRLDRLPVPDGSLAGCVCWYSIIYTPPDHLDAAFAELFRVLDVDGLLLLAFQCGSGDAVHRPDAFGTGLHLTSHRHRLADVTSRLVDAGFQVHVTTERAPEFDHETSPQAFVIAVRS